MNQDILYDAGLTKTEANAYILLIKNSPCSPPKLADLINESRTNTYKLLETLEQKNLVTRDETQKKLRYWANNPSTLLDGIKKQRQDIEIAEKRVQDSLPSLVNEYFKYSAQPSVHHFNGIDGIQQIYQDQLDDALPITFTMSLSIREFFGEQGMHTIRNKFPARGIHRKAFYPDTPHNLLPDELKIPIDESDKAMLIERTWVQEEDLQTPVELGVYGNKTYIISLGTELVGMIIESPQIASYFTELFALLDKKIRADPDYKNLPQKLLYTKMPESLKQK